MKTIVTRKGTQTLYSIIDLAKALGQPAPSVWHKIYNYMSLPAPSVKLGRRLYYSEADFLTLTAEKR